MKLRLTLDKYKEVELEVLDFASPSQEEIYEDEDDPGFHYVVRHPHLVFPRLGVEIRHGYVFDEEHDFPIEAAQLMYKQGEKNPSKYIDAEELDYNYEYFLENNFTHPECGFGQEECYVDLDEFITKDSLEKIRAKDPESDIWDYITED